MVTHKKIVYSERSGPVNTEEVLRLVKERAQELSIKQIIIPSHSGESALKAVEIFKGTEAEIVCVSVPKGGIQRIELLDKWGTHEQIPELRSQLREWKEKKTTEIPISVPTPTAEKLQKSGAKVVYGKSPYQNHPFTSKVEYPGLDTLGQVVVLSLRLISTGLEVAVKSTLIAADAGALNLDQEVIALGGVGSGLDTAIVMRPAKSTKLFDEKEGLDLREIICKPRTGFGEHGKLLERIAPE